MPLIALAIAWLAKHFTFEVAKYVAIRALIVGVMLSLGPWVIFKGLSYMLQFLMTYASSYASGQQVTPLMIQMVGIAGYLAAKIKIPEGIAIFLSLISISFVLKMIRVK